MAETSDLLVIGVILAIVAVLLDGLRRKWRDRQNRVVMKLDKNIPRAEGDEELLPVSELPNGGARTLLRDGEPPPPPRKPPSPLKHRKLAEGMNPPIIENARSDAVPLLMDTVELEETDIEHTHSFSASVQLDSFTSAAATIRNDDGEVFPEDQEFDEDEEFETIDGLDEDYLVTAISPAPGPAPALHAEADAGEADDEEYDAGQILDDDEDVNDEDPLEDGEFDDDFADEFEDEFADEIEDDETSDSDSDEDEEDWDDDDQDDDDQDDDQDDDWDDSDEDDQDDESGYDDYDDDDFDDDEDDEDPNSARHSTKTQAAENYENEPALLEDTYSRAASHFARKPAPDAPRVEPGFGGEEALSGQDPEDEFFDEDFTDAFDEQTFEEELGQPQSAQPGEASGINEPAADTFRAESRVAEDHEKSQTDKPQRTSFFSKSLLGKQNQVDLFKQEHETKAAPELEQTAPVSTPREVMVINVMARPGEVFYGDLLLPVLRQLGLQLGDMSIFHRHADQQGTGKVVFSMANMVKPGTFDLATMDSFTTPGVSLFLQLPNSYGNKASFELMLVAANVLRDTLNGELKDENRSVFTRQTIEHCRQRIQDFELALLRHK